MPEPSGNILLIQMLKEMINGDRSAELFSYPAQGKVEWQKDAAATILAQCGHVVDREQILFSNGGQNALSAILAGLFRYGDKIAVDDHTYPGIKTAAAMFGVQLVPVPSTDEGLNTDALEAVCKNEKTTASISFRLAKIQRLSRYRKSSARKSPKLWNDTIAS
nr:aminotransferase class I/II-fold pyridoxal phosphate-dependent enzyme [Tepidanaerobacter acetatoxydans]